MKVMNKMKVVSVNGPLQVGEGSPETRATCVCEWAPAQRDASVKRIKCARALARTHSGLLHPRAFLRPLDYTALLR